MKTLLCMLALALGVLALAGEAMGKGASQAKIDGPGLDHAIVISGKGEDGGVSLLGRLAQEAGFFPSVFEQRPDPMQRDRPSGELGPRYTITWFMPGPDGESVVTQEVYPYAATAVAYMRPGQIFFGTMQTHGGWYVGTSLLKQTLVEAGLPPQAPAHDDVSGLSSWLLALIAAAGAAVAGAIGFTILH